jgi:hypothetical protein
VANEPERISPQTKPARLLAVEVLLAVPEALGDDVLESCLYILRERLGGRDRGDGQSHPGGDPVHTGPFESLR